MAESSLEQVMQDTQYWIEKREVNPFTLEPEGSWWHYYPWSAGRAYDKDALQQAFESFVRDELKSRASGWPSPYYYEYRICHTVVEVSESGPSAKDAYFRSCFVNEAAYQRFVTSMQ